MQGDFTKLMDNIDEAEEEQGWCLNRLLGRKAELNSFRLAWISDDDVTLSCSHVRALTVPATTTSEKLKNEKPIKLEKIYNRSVRNAMMLRQVYSGLGGVAASNALHNAFPKLLSFLTAAGSVVAPTATMAIATAPKNMFMNIT